jgi:hypothetical protein
VRYHFGILLGIACALPHQHELRIDGATLLGIGRWLVQVCQRRSNVPLRSRRHAIRAPFRSPYYRNESYEQVSDPQRIARVFQNALDKQQ